MAKQLHDCGTLELPGFAKPLGRPRQAQVKPGHVRTAEWRQRVEKRSQDLQKRFQHVRDIELARYMAWFDNFDEKERHAMWQEFGRRQGWR